MNTEDCSTLLHTRTDVVVAAISAAVWRVCVRSMMPLAGNDPVATSLYPPFTHLLRPPLLYPPPRSAEIPKDVPTKVEIPTVPV